MRRALALLVLIVTGAAHAQSGTFRRGQKNLPTSRRVSGLLTADNCTGATQSIGSSSITWTRATTATCTKNDGTLTTVTSGQPRCNSSGCLVEPATTNVLLNSGDFSQASWSKNTVTISQGDANCNPAPDGTNTAWRLTANGGATDAYVGYINFTISSSASSWALSVYSKKASDNAGTPAVSFFFVGSATTGVAMTLGSSWARSSNLSSSTGVTSAFVYLGGGASFTTADGAICLWGPQLEQKAVATAYVPTGATSVTRNADAPTIPKPSWLVNARGCVAATGTVATAPLASNLQLVTASGSQYLATILNNGGSSSVSNYDATTAAQRTITSPLGRSVTVLSKWSGTTKSITADGLTTSSAYDGTFFSSTTSLYLGTNATPAEPLYGYISNVKLGSTTGACL